MLRCALFLIPLAAWFPTGPAAHAQTPAEDEALLKEAKVDTDAAGLVAFFKKRILPEHDASKVGGLIKDLGDDRFPIREKASDTLIALGPSVTKMLRDSIGNTDPEVVARVKEALEIVERTSTPPLLGAAARLLGQRKPPEAAQVLLDFAPVVDNDDVVEVIRQTLIGLAKRDGKAEPALLKALEGKQALRRMLAADVLVRTSGLDNAESRKLLADADPMVRLRTALALIEREDREAVPALIAVLPALKLHQAWQAEDVLHRLAGDLAPTVSLGEDEASRKKARDAWEGWWKEHNAKVELKKLKEAAPFLNHTVLGFQDFNGRGVVREQDKEGKTRWEFNTNLTFPVNDLQVLPNGNVLITEINGGRVSERNKKGDIVWQQAAQQPVAGQRLVNGNTFIATQNNAFEYDAQGKQVFTYTRGKFDILSARKHRNGEYILLTRTHIVRINAQGKENGSWGIGRNYNYGTFDILPNGNILVPLTTGKRVVEYKLDGTEVWSVQVNFPTGAQKLPNGNVLVTSMNYRTISEYDKTGKQVSTVTLQGNPYVVIKR